MDKPYSVVVCAFVILVVSGSSYKALYLLGMALYHALSH